jgi:hypothetical protein
MTEALVETLEQVLTIQAESAKRLLKAPEDGFPMSVAMLGYEVPASSTKTVPKKRAKAARKTK